MDMIAEEELDAIVASQPFDRHGALIPQLLQAGVPIMTEKPLAASVEVGQMIVEAVEKSGTFHMLGYHKRSDPATTHAKSQIDELQESGELGRMTFVRLLMAAGDWVANGFEGLIREPDSIPNLGSDPPPPDMDEKTFEKYLTFVNFYIHQVNLLRHLMDEPYKVVFADKAGVLFVGESSSGITCTIEMSPYQTTVDWQEQALVCFEHGWIKIDLPAPLASYRPGQVEVFKDPPGKESSPFLSRPTLPFVGAMRQQAKDFIRAVKGEIPPTTTAQEALEDLKIARDYIRLSTGK
jgi:predicted dehydrogenase